MKKHDAIILGGGVSGLLMAQRLKRNFPGIDVCIVDKPNAQIHPFHLHRPIDLPSLSELTPAKFKVNIYNGKVFKTTPTIDDINSYALKTFDRLQITNVNNVEDQVIYPVHKDEFIEAVSKGIKVEHGDIQSVDLKTKRVATMTDMYEYHYLISTIPLNVLLDLAGCEYENVGFASNPFYVGGVAMEATNMYQMVYNTDSEHHLTRATLLNDRLFLESFAPKPSSRDFDWIWNLYGVELPASFKQLTPGRIHPLPNKVRKPLLHWLTEEHDVFTLGRFGAWTFKVTNDVWEDTEFISNLIYAKAQAKNYKGE